MYLASSTAKGTCLIFQQLQVGDTAIGFAVVAFYFLDFSLNALQASLRNLLLDVTPPSQLNSGNAWHGRMTHAGNIIGYGFGALEYLSSLSTFNMLTRATQVSFPLLNYQSCGFLGDLSSGSFVSWQ